MRWLPSWPGTQNSVSLQPLIALLSTLSFHLAKKRGGNLFLRHHLLRSAPLLYIHQSARFNWGLQMAFP